MTLILEAPHVEKIRKHSEEVFPIEACGIVAGMRKSEERIVHEVYSTRNILNSPSAYQVDPEEQLRVFLEAEENGFEVVGFYHSHPYWSATPSTADLSQAYYPEHSYIIYSVSEKELKSYVFLENRFVAEELAVSGSGESKR